MAAASSRTAAAGLVGDVGDDDVEAGAVLTGDVAQLVEVACRPARGHDGGAHIERREGELAADAATCTGDDDAAPVEPTHATRLIARSTASITRSTSASVCAAQSTAGWIGGHSTPLAHTPRRTSARSVEVAGEDVAPVARRLLGHVQLQHRADTGDVAELVAAADYLEGAAQAGAEAVDVVEHGLALEHVESRHPGGDRHRVGGERAGMEHVVSIVESEHVVHHVGTPAEGGEWQPAADGLADARQVGGHAEVAGRASEAEAEASHDLVENEQGAGLGGRLAYGLGELGVGDDGAAGGERHRLHEHGGELVAVGADEVARSLGVVERQHHDVAGQARRHAVRVDHRLRPLRRPEGGTGDRREQEVVVGAVVVALELGVPRTPGERPRRPQCGPVGLRAGVGEAQSLEVGHVGA